MKAVRPPSTFMSSQSLGASFNSPVIDLTQEDIGALQLNYTGTSPTGTLVIQGSLDQVNWANLYVSVSGNSTPSNSIAMPGAASPILIELNQLPVPYIRIGYTYTSGSGSMSGIVASKRLGD